MTFEAALQGALRVLYQHNPSSDGELESVYIADFSNDSVVGYGVRESVRAYLWDCEGELRLDFSEGLDSLKNQVFLAFKDQNGKTITPKALHFVSNRWKVFARVNTLKEFE
ncbi:hypothetical protein [Helicobacter sp. T3_23-1056]